MSKNLDEKVDQLEAAVDPNTVISVGGINFTPAKLMIVGGIISTVLGGLYGAFEVYKDYMDMKEKIQTYVAPDLTEFDKRLELITKEMAATKTSVQETVDYSRDIKNGLREDIMRIEKQVDRTEQRTKESEEKVRQMIDIAAGRFENKRDQLASESDRKIKDLEERMNSKIQRALDNPLAGK
jgi:hypothetical protein